MISCALREVKKKGLSKRFFYSNDLGLICRLSHTVAAGKNGSQCKLDAEALAALLEALKSGRLQLAKGGKGGGGGDDDDTDVEEEGPDLPTALNATLRSMAETAQQQTQR